MPARRRAEKFNAWVEGTAPDALNDARILEVVSVLRTAEAPALRADFAAELRDRLMAEADLVLVHTERNLVVPASLAPTQRRHHRRLAVAASALAVVGATTSVSMAAQHALPGDALYPIKRALENAQTGLTSGDAKTEEMLSNAASRLNEASALATRDTPESAAAVADTLGDFTTQADEAADQALASSDPQQITQLRDFTADSMHELELLDSVVPEEARPALAVAARMLTEIDRRALAQCPTCGGAVIDLPKIFLASATAITAGKGSQSGTDSGDATTVGGITLPSVDPSVTIAPAHPATSTDTSTPSVGDTDGDQSLVPSGETTTKQNPVTDLLDPVAPITSSLEPITSPLLDAVDGAISGTLDAVTPKE